MYLCATLHKAVRLFPTSEAVVGGARHLTYAQVTGWVERLAAGLQGLGLMPQAVISMSTDRNTS